MSEENKNKKVEKEFCTNCKKEVMIVYLGQERGGVSDMKINHYGCQICKCSSMVKLQETPFAYALDAD